MFKKSFFYLPLLFAFTLLTVSCESEQIKSLNSEVEEIYIDLSNFSLEGVDFGLGLTDEDGYFTSTIDLNDNNIDDILNELSEFMFSEDLKEDEYIETITTYNPEENTLLVRIIKESLPETTEEKTTYSDEKCGEGEGWIYFKNCLTEKCVRENMEKILMKTIDKDGLIIGKCIDTRIRYTLTGVRLCGRTVDC